jgi:hypothetical protein
MLYASIAQSVLLFVSSLTLVAPTEIEYQDQVVAQVQLTATFVSSYPDDSGKTAVTRQALLRRNVQAPVNGPPITLGNINKDNVEIEIQLTELGPIPGCPGPKIYNTIFGTMYYYQLNSVGARSVLETIQKDKLLDDREKQLGIKLLPAKNAIVVVGLTETSEPNFSPLMQRLDEGKAMYKLVGTLDTDINFVSLEKYALKFLTVDRMPDAKQFDQPFLDGRRGIIVEICVDRLAK